VGSRVDQPFERSARKPRNPTRSDLAPGTRGEIGVGYFPVDESIGRPGCGGVGVVGPASARSDRQPGPSRAGASESKAATFKEGSSSVPGCRASCVDAGLDDPPRYISNGTGRAWAGRQSHGVSRARGRTDKAHAHHGCPDLRRAESTPALCARCPPRGPSGPSRRAQWTAQGSDQAVCSPRSCRIFSGPGP
jgi:hypothetical protein